MPVDNRRTKLRIEIATADRIDSIIAIADAAELSHWSVKDYKEEVTRADSLFLVAIGERDETVGFIIGRSVPPADAKSIQDAEIYNIAIDKNFRRFGVASELMKAFLFKCRSRDIGRIWLDVRSRNSAAIEFYKKAGFAASGIRRGFYNNPSDDAIIMKSML